MTGPHPETESPETRPISVAELLARNGTIGAPAVTRRRRRRRGDSDAVSVAELTGEIPVIRDDEAEIERPAPAPKAPEATEAREARDEQPANASAEHVAYWSEPEPRWPKSPPRAQRPSGPQLSAYPRPVGHTASDAEHADGQNGSAELESDAEGMSPDPADDYADIPVDVMDSEVRAAEVATEDSAYVRSYLQASDSTLSSDSTLFGGQTLADELARRRGDEAAGTTGPAQPAEPAAPERPEEAGGQAQPSPGRFEALWRGSLVVLQSILAVAFGAGLFVAFDQLWRWNSIVALVLSVLVILGLVVGVRVVRKTEDIASTLIAVAVGALITLGPLALSLQSG
jgi:hypothetical protein